MRRHHPYTPEKDCSSERGVGLVNTHLAMNIDSYESLISRIGRLRLKRCRASFEIVFNRKYCQLDVSVVSKSYTG
ncbi:unnamed protein product [Heligmosomoides polygyrus]|uniref:Transposase n=1 Tax=Heligmosomoides polygyrus TaxID=6339 RepID=A0A183FPE8_HELPZ|nr:unnamed protein product [Heligmosomoides polygyrus]